MRAQKDTEVPASAGPTTPPLGPRLPYTSPLRTTAEPHTPRGRFTSANRIVSNVPQGGGAGRGRGAGVQEEEEEEEEEEQQQQQQQQQEQQQQEPCCRGRAFPSQHAGQSLLHRAACCPSALFSAARACAFVLSGNIDNGTETVPLRCVTVAFVALRRCRCRVFPLGSAALPSP